MVRRSARFIPTILAGALILAIGACTPDPDGNGDEEGAVELVWAVGGAEAQPGGVHQDIVEAWNEQNEDIQVRIETLPEDADAQREQQTLVLDASGPEFDIVAMDVIWTGEYAENEWLLSLEEHRDQVEEAALPGPFDSAIFEGELWGVPHNSNAGFLYYRSDLVDEAPTTWEELRDVGMEAADEEGIAGFVGQGAQYEGFVVNFLELYWSAGGEIFNEDNTEVEWPSGDAAMTALEYMTESFADGFYASGFNTSMEEEARSEFQGGNAVFMRNWPYAVGLIEGDDESPAQENLELAPLPTFDGDGTISALGGFNNAVSAFSEHPDEATEFILWLGTDPEPQTMLGERGTPPSMAAVYDDLADDPVMEILGDVLPDARARPPIPEWPEISDVMQRELFAAYNGDQDPQAAIDAVEEFLQGVVE
jgi:multiple sugar transport system substrate-binding protein